MPIGILVDDAIVVVENIYRRWLDIRPHRRRPDRRRRRRGRQPDHPGHLHRRRGAAADGLRHRHDGPLHAADPGAFVGGDGLLAVRRFRVRAVAGGAGEAEHERRFGGRRRPNTARRRTIGKVYGRIITPIMNSRPLGMITLFAIIAAMLGRGGDVSARDGRLQDAALRQQVGVAGRHRHARGHGSVRHRQSGASARRRDEDGARK